VASTPSFRRNLVSRVHATANLANPSRYSIASCQITFQAGVSDRICPQETLLTPPLILKAIRAQSDRQPHTTFASAPARFPFFSTATSSRPSQDAIVVISLAKGAATLVGSWPSSTKLARTRSRPA
jgi:hypothetical protein